MHTFACSSRRSIRQYVQHAYNWIKAAPTFLFQQITTSYKICRNELQWILCINYIVLSVPVDTFNPSMQYSPKTRKSFHFLRSASYSPVAFAKKNSMHFAHAPCSAKGLILQMGLSIFKSVHVLWIIVKKNYQQFSVHSKQVKLLWLSPSISRLPIPMDSIRKMYKVFTCKQNKHSARTQIRFQ